MNDYEALLDFLGENPWKSIMKDLRNIPDLVLSGPAVFYAWYQLLHRMTLNIKFPTALHIVCLAKDESQTIKILQKKYKFFSLTDIYVKNEQAPTGVFETEQKQLVFLYTDPKPRLSFVIDIYNIQFFRGRFIGHPVELAAFQSGICTFDITSKLSMRGLFRLLKRDCDLLTSMKLQILWTRVELWQAVWNIILRDRKKDLRSILTKWNRIVHERIISLPNDVDDSLPFLAVTKTNPEQLVFEKDQSIFGVVFIPKLGIAKPKKFDIEWKIDYDALQPLYSTYVIFLIDIQHDTPKCIGGVCQK